jgi:hypothetical protein
MPRAGGWFCIADFRGVLRITKKVFFNLSKNTIFWQFLKRAGKDRFGAMDTGMW